MSPTSRSSRRDSASTTSSESVRCSGSSTTPSSSAETWPRIAVSGVRSSCETDIRKLRSRGSVSARRSVISSNRSARWPISPAPPSRDLDAVVAARDLVGRAREREHGPHDRAREVPGEQPGDEQAERARDREPAHERAHAVGRRRSSASRRRSRRSAACRRRPARRPRGTCARAGRRELERQRLARRPVDRLEVAAAAGPSFSPGNELARRRSRCWSPVARSRFAAAKVGGRRERWLREVAATAFE